MIRSTTDGKIVINMPECLQKGRFMKDEIAYVYMTVSNGVKIGLWDLVGALKICFERYPKEHRDLVPIIHVFVKLGDERKLEFIIKFTDTDMEYFNQLTNQLVI